MAIKRELIQFTIVNSTDCDYNIPMFQQNVYSINATTKYSWDVTTAVLSCGTGTIVVNSVTYPLSYTATLTGLISALNALGFGFFCTETIFGSTYIYVVDDTNVYGDLDLCPSGITTTTTTTTTTAGTTTSTTTSSTTAPSTTTTSSTTSTTTSPSTTTTSSTTSTTTVPTTSTTTSTTTPPPTTTTTSTTTSCVGTFTLINNSGDLDISGMLIGGASVIVTSGAFPSTPATTINGTPDTSLTIPNVYALQLTQVTSGIAGQTITVFDSLGNSQTQTISIGTNNIIFNGVDFNCITTVQIVCNAAGATTTTSTTTSTTAPPTSTTTTTSTTTAPETSTTTTTTTVAPTTTTTSTTTSTTTLLAAPLRVENTLSLDISVSDVTVNAVTATPLTGSYPIPAGENRDLTTTQFGTYSITVTFTNTITGQRITVTDSNGTSQCQTVNTSSTFTYTNCVVNGLTQVLILCEDGVC